MMIADSGLAGKVFAELKRLTGVAQTITIQCGTRIARLDTALEASFHSRQLRIGSPQESAAFDCDLEIACRVACLLLGFSALMAVPSPATSAAAPRALREYRLRLYHTHTGESLDVVFRRGDSYIPEALAQLNYHLRDHRTGDVEDFDARLFDLLADLAETVGRPGGIMEVICGYRAPGTNALLRQHSSGVAEQSLHMQGMAIDIRMPGIKTSVLRDAALALQRGGVGYYPGSDFVHIDVGRVRSW